MTAIDPTAVRHLEEKYDPEMQFRPIAPPASWLVGALLVALSGFHYYTAGFGILREATQRGVHLALVLGLIFLVFGFRRKQVGVPGWENASPSASTATCGWCCA